MGIIIEGIKIIVKEIANSIERIGKNSNLMYAERMVQRCKNGGKSEWYRKFDTRLPRLQ
jgi:hypothetical protein